MTNRPHQSGKPDHSDSVGMGDAENPANTGLATPETFRQSERSDNDSQDGNGVDLPRDPVQLLFYLTGGVARTEALRAVAKFYTAIGLARIKEAFQDPEHGPALARLGYSSLEDVCRHLGIDKSTAYELAKNVEVLGETAYRRAEQAGLTIRGFRAVRSLPKGVMDEVEKVLENPEGRSAKEVRDAIETMVKAHKRERTRADQAEQREKRAKTEQEKQKELAHARLEELNQLRTDRGLEYAAVNDIPVTSLAQDTATYIIKGMALASRLKNRRYNDEDRRILRRLGGRAGQLGQVVMDAFTQAMGGYENLKKGDFVDEDKAGAWIPDGVVEPPPMGDDTMFRDPPKHRTEPEDEKPDGDESNV